MRREKVSEGMHIEELKPDKIVEANPMVSIVEYLMSTELSNRGWRQYTVERLLQRIEELREERNIPQTERHYLLLKRRITKCTTIEKCLEVLGETLF